MPNDLRWNVYNIRKPFHLALLLVFISPVAVTTQSEKYLTHFVSRGQFISPLPLPLHPFFLVTADFRIRMNNGSLLCTKCGRHISISEHANRPNMLESNLFIYQHKHSSDDYRVISLLHSLIKCILTHSCFLLSTSMNIQWISKRFSQNISCLCNLKPSWLEAYCCVFKILIGKIIYCKKRIWEKWRYKC